MESSANPTLRSAVTTSQDSGLKTACSSIPNPVMKGMQVFSCGRGVVKRFPTFVFTERADIQAYNAVGKLD